MVASNTNDSSVCGIRDLLATARYDPLRIAAPPSAALSTLAVIGPVQRPGDWPHAVYRPRPPTGSPCKHPHALGRQGASATTGQPASLHCGRHIAQGPLFCGSQEYAAEDVPRKKKKQVLKQPGHLVRHHMGRGTSSFSFFLRRLTADSVEGCLIDFRRCGRHSPGNSRHEASHPIPSQYFCVHESWVRRPVDTRTGLPSDPSCPLSIHQANYSNRKPHGGEDEPGQLAPATSTPKMQPPSLSSCIVEYFALSRVLFVTGLAS